MAMERSLTCKSSASESLDCFDWPRTSCRVSEYGSGSAVAAIWSRLVYCGASQSPTPVPVGSRGPRALCSGGSKAPRPGAAPCAGVRGAERAEQEDPGTSIGSSSHSPPKSNAGGSVGVACPSASSPNWGASAASGTPGSLPCESAGEDVGEVDVREGPQGPAATCCFCPLPRNGRIRPDAATCPKPQPPMLFGAAGAALLPPLA
mmetsp:Transcript_63137/g.181025  ORF Transcript_63137/g.181025 Transcript_63137/m.181025 type:complete len:205 (+) Transcript_63137:660-1274(+)